MASIREQKISLRKHFLEQCKNQVKDQPADLKYRLCQFLKQYLKIECILAYSAYFPAEIDLLDILLDNNYKIFLPVVADNSMNFYNLKKHADLQKGKFGILEPKKDKLFNPDTPAICFIPGLAFDKQGNRLGRGLGYYDRFLSQYKNIVKVGICYSFQIYEKIPVEKHDKKMDEVICLYPKHIIV